MVDENVFDAGLADYRTCVAYGDHLSYAEKDEIGRRLAGSVWPAAAGT
jgi:hypothetical protein